MLHGLFHICMIIVAWSFVQPCSLWLGRGGFIAIIDPPSFYCFSGNHLGRTVAIKRIFRMMAAGWALWITGRWLDLPLSIRRYLPYSFSVHTMWLAGDGLLLGPVSATVPYL